MRTVALNLLLYVGTGLVSVLLLLELVWLPFAVKHEDPNQKCMGVEMLFFYPHGDIFTVLRLPLGFVVIWMLIVAKTPHMKLAATYVLVNWSSAVFYFLSALANLCDGPFHTVEIFYLKGVKTREAQIWADPVNAAFLVLTVWTGFVLYAGRVEAVEATALQSFRIQRLRPLLAVCLPLIPTLSISFGLDKAGFGGARIVFMLAAASLFVIWGAATFIYFRALFLIMRAASKAAREAPAWIAPAAQKVNRAMLSEMVCLIISFVSSALSVILLLVYVFFRPDFLKVTYKVFFFFDALCNVTFALMLCGVFSGGRQGAGHREELAAKRKASRGAAMKRWNMKTMRRKSYNDWQEKIHELSERGVSLSQLLAFYRDLPKRMPHFDPSRHTTCDVVFQAIIPMTSEQKCAAAEIMMDNEPTLPEKMVTHSWGNIFRDLIAGILADAFGDAEYLFFCELLDYEMPLLERWVEFAGVGNRTYWICAFSVNQHRGVCGNTDIVDRITGQRCPPCNCGLEKAWNNTSPTLPDGRSVPCEMNKFDDMMRMLASDDPFFAQAVVIDSAFETFNRAWCIAEIATAKELGMRQDLKIGFAPQLMEHEDELKHLHIRDMRASRPEDKAEILKNIEDPAAFDLAMQHLIWEDLLPSWSSMDAVERMAAAGRIIRWLSTEAWKNSPLQERSSTVSV